MLDRAIHVSYLFHALKQFQPLLLFSKGQQGNYAPMNNLADRIKNEFQERQKRNSSYSLRAYAQWLELSPAQVSQMISGKRPATLNTLGKIKSKLNLSPKEERVYIEEIVSTKISPGESKKEVLNLKEDEFKLIADWYHFAILALLKLKGASLTLRSIASRLGVSFLNARDALERLERLKIIQRRPHLEQISPALEVTSEIPSSAIQLYHRQNLNMAIDRLNDCPPASRQFQSVYLNLREDQIKRYKKLIDQFLDEASEMASTDEDTKLYALNVQLFPVKAATDTRDL
jgi:uncharacterized protein (TIGR02147 family)